MIARRSWFARCVELPLDRPWLVLACAALLTVAAALAWPFVRFEPDVSRVLPQDHPHVRIAQLLDDRSRPARTLWVLLHGDDLERAVPDVAAALAASPLVTEVVATRDGLFAAAAARARAAPLWFVDAAERAELARLLSPSGRAAAIAALRQDLADDPIAARELALRDPLGVRWLLAGQSAARRFGFADDTELAMLADHRHALLQLRGARDAYDADFASALCAHVEAVLQGRDYDMFGGYAVARADQARIRGDFERASAWSVVAIALYLCWVMRGVRLPLIVQLPAMLSIAWAIPFASLWFGPLPTVAVAAVAVLCGLGVDFAIHYAAKYRDARLSLAHEPAVRLVQRTTVTELVIDMATTAVTFLAVGAGTRGGLRAFGLLLALGLCGSLLFTVLALPVLLRWAGERRDPERSLVARLADRWLARRAARPCAWAVIGLAVAGVVAIAAEGVPLSAAAESLRPAGDPVAAARDRIEAQLGFATVPVVALWPADRDPSPLWTALAGLRDQGGLRFWTGLERGDTAAGRREVAEFRAATAGFVPAALADFERAGLAPAAFRPALEELSDRLAADPEPAPVQSVDVDGVSHRAVTLWPAARVDAERFAALEARLTAAAGPGVLLHGVVSVTRALEQLLRRDLQRACILAVLLAILMVTLWQRSVRYGLLALVPSTIGLVATLSLVRWLGVPLSMVSFVAVPFVLGIGVDEGVHLVGHFRHRAAATGATGVGVVRTSAGTILGFSALLLAESPGLRLLGGMVGFGSACSMLACMFVLAPLLAMRASGDARE